MGRNVWLVGMLALSACQAASTPSQSGSPPSLSASSSAAASAAEPMELVATSDPLPPGTYTRAGFEPPVTFELGEGWRAVQLVAGFFDVQRDVGSPDVIAVQFARPVRIWSASRVESIAVTTTAGAATALAANDRLAIRETSESELGGLTGTVVEIENAGEGHEHVMELAAGELGIDPGRRLWVGFYDTDAGLLAVMIGGSVDRWDEALAAAEPVLESIRIDEGPTGVE